MIVPVPTIVSVVLPPSVRVTGEPVTVAPFVAAVPVIPLGSMTVAVPATVNVGVLEPIVRATGELVIVPVPLVIVQSAGAAA